MDFLSGGSESAIDRAFGQPAHTPASNDRTTNGPDGTNAAAPMPRKRPTAKPATARALDPNAGFAADSTTSADGNKNSGSGSAVESASGSPRGEAVATKSPTSAGPPTTAAHQQRNTTNTNTAFQQQQQQQTAMMAQLEDLEGQMGNLRAQTDDSASAAAMDPQMQAHMMRRLTVLMGDVQQLMTKLTTMAVAPAAAAVASKPATQHSSMAGTPSATSPGPEQLGLAHHHHHHHHAHHHDGNNGGLRTTAKPFEPPMSSAGPDYGAAFAPRGGAAPQQRYAPIPSSTPGGFQAATSAVHWGAMGAQAGGGLGGGQQQPPTRPQGCVICLVEFKRGRMKRYESDAFVAPGNYIVVEGDRGEDCGLVVHTYQRLPDGSNGRSETLEGVTIDMAKVKPDTGRVRRIATEQEVERLHGEIATLERHALKTCRERVEQMNLDMEVVDCEYQFDRKKITFFFDSGRAVDFRELTKDLFKHFGARIWLENINSKVKNVVPDGALSHADKLLYAERGLRPPRR